MECGGPPDYVLTLEYIQVFYSYLSMINTLCTFIKKKKLYSDSLSQNVNDCIVRKLGKSLFCRFFQTSL